MTRQRQRIIELLAKGWSYEDIAKEVGSTSASVRTTIHLMRKAGIIARPAIMVSDGREIIEAQVEFSTMAALRRAASARHMEMDELLSKLLDQATDGILDAVLDDGIGTPERE